MKKPNAHQERERTRRKAIDCFIQGAAALSNWPSPEPKHVAHALLQAARATYLIAQLDDKGEALELAEAWLRAQAA